MKFSLHLSDDPSAFPTKEGREALCRLGFEFEKHHVQGVWQEQPLGVPVVELADLDMLVHFTEEWGPVRLHGQVLALLGEPTAAATDLP